MAVNCLAYKSLLDEAGIKQKLFSRSCVFIEVRGRQKSRRDLFSCSQSDVVSRRKDSDSAFFPTFSSSSVANINKIQMQMRSFQICSSSEISFLFFHLHASEKWAYTRQILIERNDSFLTVFSSSRSCFTVFSMKYFLQIQQILSRIFSSNLTKYLLTRKSIIFRRS